MKKKILITTGGSGGHVMPALILSKHLLKEFDVVIDYDWCLFELLAFFGYFSGSAFY